MGLVLNSAGLVSTYPTRAPPPPDDRPKGDPLKPLGVKPPALEQPFGNLKGGEDGQHQEEAVPADLQRTISQPGWGPRRASSFFSRRSGVNFALEQHPSSQQEDRHPEGVELLELRIGVHIHPPVGQPSGFEQGLGLLAEVAAFAAYEHQLHLDEYTFLEPQKMARRTRRPIRRCMRNLPRIPPRRPRMAPWVPLRGLVQAPPGQPFPKKPQRREQEEPPGGSTTGTPRRRQRRPPYAVAAAASSALAPGPRRCCPPRRRAG